MMNVQPVVLEGTYVKLEPLSQGHHQALCEVGLDTVLWKYTTTQVQSSEDMKRYIATALTWQSEGTALPFVIIEKPSGIVVGSTRYANIDVTNKRMEIGWTWIARPWQRTAINTEAKYLLLTHAFENLGCMRVEFKTDVLNVQSRNALTRIGAKEEGVFRNHMITQTGRIRNTIYFSIIDSEWPGVKLRLTDMMNQQR